MQPALCGIHTLSLESRDNSATEHHPRSHRWEPAQVYSLRIPAGQLDRLRRLAADRHMTSSALMRSWVLERLDAESRHDAPAAEVNPSVTGTSLLEQLMRLVIREELERAAEPGLLFACWKCGNQVDPALRDPCQVYRNDRTCR
ncbi:MAG: hypothetical protein ACRDNF_06640 [Streptosporangiaceae bacterium]